VETKFKCLLSGLPAGLKIIPTEKIIESFGGNLIKSRILELEELNSISEYLGDSSILKDNQ
jgi:hypothetical protein